MLTGTRQGHRHQTSFITGNPILKPNGFHVDWNPTRTPKPNRFHPWQLDLEANRLSSWPYMTWNGTPSLRWWVDQCQAAFMPGKQVLKP